GRLTQEKKKLELQESEVEDEILRLQRASTAAFNRLLRLRKQKRLLQSRSEVEASRLGAELDQEDAVERDRLGVDELPFDGPSESGLVPELRSLGHVDVVDWSSVLGADSQDWVFAGLVPENVPTPGSTGGAVPGNSGGG
ncbi:hypothetical protein MCOR02_012460, partial [Pyricularia oryzae]